jgi:hypothetical protein
MMRIADFSFKGSLRNAILGVCALVSTAMAVPDAAHAERGWTPGAAAAIGAIGGFALGAAVAGSPSTVYYGRPAYREYGYGDWRWHHHRQYWAPPVDDCYVVRERVWIEGWGWDVRPRTVCQ